MFQKLVLAATFCATASFAAWDKFPVLENHKGEMVAGTGFIRDGEYEPMQLTPYLGSRFAVMPNLELGVLLPYYVNLNKNNDNGILNPVLMARYQFTPSVNAFLDITAPINDTYNCYDVWVFNFGAQFSKDFGLVNLGTELGLGVNASTKFSPPLRLNFGAEAEFKAGALTPFVGFDALMLLGDLTIDGEKVDSFKGEIAVYPYVGLKYAITPNVSVQASAKTAFGYEVVKGSNTPIIADLNLKMSF